MRTSSLLTHPAPRPWVPILLYHRVVPRRPASDPRGLTITTRTFESHLRWLSYHGYRSVSLQQVGSLLGPHAPVNTLRPHDLDDPRRLVAITFDGGYYDNLAHAFPLLVTYGFTATIFVVAGAVGGVNDFDRHTRGYEEARMLSADGTRSLHRYGIDIGAHSVSLVDLSMAQLEHELMWSKLILEDIVDAPVRHFSYPHSRSDARIEAAVAENGYRLACAGVGTRFTRYCLHRVAASPRGGLDMEARIKWRRLKWSIRSRAPLHPSENPLEMRGLGG